MPSVLQCFPFMPKKFLFVSLSALISDIAWQIRKEGNEVKYFIADPGEKEVGSGFVEKVDKWEDFVDWADIVIFDEINYAIDYGYLDEKEVLSRLKSKPPKVHVILTGRNAKSGLIQFSDLVTEMKEVKHPFKTQGLLAHAGIDF